MTTASKSAAPTISEVSAVDGGPRRALKRGHDRGVERHVLYFDAGAVLAFTLKSTVPCSVCPSSPAVFHAIL